MRVYIASKLANIAQATEVAAALRAAGHVITYPWFEVGKVNQDRWAEVATAEHDGVVAAECFILLLPFTLPHSTGSHTELGLALGRGIPVIVVAPEPWHFYRTDAEYYPCIFYHLPAVRLIINPEPAQHLVDVLGVLPHAS